MMLHHSLLRRAMRCTAPDGHNEMPSGGMSPEFAKIKPLPGAKRQPSCCDRDRDAVSDQYRLDVGGHIIRPFIAVSIIGRPFRHNFMQKAVEVCADFRLSI